MSIIKNLDGLGRGTIYDPAIDTFAYAIKSTSLFPILIDEMNAMEDVNWFNDNNWVDIAKNDLYTDEKV